MPDLSRRLRAIERRLGLRPPLPARPVLPRRRSVRGDLARLHRGLARAERLLDERDRKQGKGAAPL
jgi:hypothetical protein